MPDLLLHGIETRLNEQINRLEVMIEKADKVTRVSLKIAYFSLGISIVAVIIAALPFILD